MFESNSLATRIAVGKLVGALIGATAFILIPHFLPDASVMLHWGVFLWYIIFGAVIGLFGVMTTAPVVNIPMPWWFRGAYIGGWMNLAISLIAYDTLAALMLAVFGENGLFVSPFWMVLEGVLVGLTIDYFATRFGGEGKAIVD